MKYLIDISSTLYQLRLARELNKLGSRPMLGQKPIFRARIKGLRLQVNIHVVGHRIGWYQPDFSEFYMIVDQYTGEQITVSREA